MAFLSGGAALQLLKIFWPDIKKPVVERIEAKKSFYNGVAPLLRVSSELYGKMESLAKEDFSSFINPKNSNSKDPEHNKLYFYFLLAQFWAHLEYIRLESQYISLSKIKKGKELLRFIDTAEARNYRIIDRSIQRIIGECLIANKNQKFRVMTLSEFLDELESPESKLKKWIDKLDSEFSLLKNKDKKFRQTVLTYGIIAAIIIDHFDPEYKAVRRRKIYKNKLSESSKKLIKDNLLGHYLKFIKNDWKFYI